MKHLLKSLAIVLVALLSFVSCQNNTDLELDSLPLTENQVSSPFTRSIQNNSESYWDSLEPINWAELQSLEDRFKYFNLPDSQVKNMTTEELTVLIANYPLNYLISLYNNPLTAIDLVCENSNLHKEFIRREDAAIQLAHFFLNHNCSAKENITPTKYDYIDELFLEYLMQSKIIDISPAKQILATAITQKKEQYAADTTMSCARIFDPLMSIEDLVYSEGHSRTSVSATSTPTVYTPRFQSLSGLIRSEMSQTQINDWYSYVSRIYPNAIYRGAASTKYNCHSYAWYDNSQNNNIWLNALDDNGTRQLSKYWSNNDVYMSCPVGMAEIVYYSRGDHSAIVLGQDRVISKWGDGPLMEHSYQNCPYTASDLEFFKYQPGNCIRTSSANFSGNTSFIVNSQQDYYIIKKCPGMTASWTVQNLSNPSNTSSFTKTVYSGGSLRLVCHEVGAYKLRVDFYYKGADVAFSDMIVLAMPN